MVAAGRRVVAALRGLRMRGEGGFTLLELLVAVAVLAVLVGVVPRSFVFARSILDHSRDWMDARLVAESVLNDVLVGPAIAPGARSGVIEGRRWHATLRRRGGLGVDASATSRTLLDVRIEVDVGAGKMLEVETMRIGGAQ